MTRAALAPLLFAAMLASADGRDLNAPWIPAPAAADDALPWTTATPAADAEAGGSLPLFGGLVADDLAGPRTVAAFGDPRPPSLPTPGYGPTTTGPTGFPPAVLAPPPAPLPVGPCEAPAEPRSAPPVVWDGPAGPPAFIAPPPVGAATAGMNPGRLYGAGGPTRGVDWSRAVRLDTPTSAALLDFQNRQTDKQLILLGSLPNAFPAGEPVHPVVVPAVQMRLSALLGRTNTKDKFGYLGRFPPDFNSRTATDLRILQANLAATAYFTPWAAGYVETLFSDVFTFPTFEQGSFQVRQAYAVFGDPRAFPLYAFIGKKNISYGDFGTLSPFSQALPWHYFAALGEGAGVGFVNGGFHAVLTGLAGGRGIRVSDSPDDGHVNNFAVNTHYAGRLGRIEYLAGAGYLHGTIYDADVPEHIRNDLFGPLNGAFDVNGTLRAGRWTFAGEYVETLGDWPVTNFPVSAWKAEGAYDLTALGRPLRLSVSWSEGKQAPSGLEFDRNDQLVIGAGWQPNPNALLSLEYVRSIGFAPLIGLTAPGVSERDARQNSLVLGVSLVL